MIEKLIKNKFLNEKPTQSVAAAALIISLAGVASRFLGLLRDRILAGQFGAGDTLDAYYAAFRIPDLIYNLMIVGALSAAFIPVFTELIAQDKEDEAWKLSSGILSLQIIITGIISILLVIFSPQLMKLVTPGYVGEKMQLTVLLTRIMFLSPFLLGISGIFGGILVSFKKFLIYSLAPIFYNLGIIVGAVFFVRYLGPIGLALGVVLGALLHMLVQFPSVKFSGFHFEMIFSKAIKNHNVRKVFKLMIPRTLTIAVSQINFTIITIFASTLASGSLAVFNFANNIQSAPLGLFGVSFSIAVFPTLSALAVKKKKDEFINAFAKTFSQILFFVIPLSVFIYVLRAQTVRVLLGSGKFNWNDTILTFQTLGLLAMSLFAQSLLPLLTRAFYALQNTKTPLYIGIVSEIINLSLVVILIKNFGVFGLAVAFSVSSILNMLLLLVFLKKEVGSIGGKEIGSSTFQILIASLVGGAAAQFGKYLIGTQGELDTFIAVLTQLVVAGGLGIAAFSLVAYYLRIPEFFQFTNSLTRKVFRSKKTIGEDTGEVSGI
ncbi:MAG: murein biosynthesis integral membrane protein MurJ [Candidatus Moranbacteria bacterium]|nr:murein biosynthesis integral membrane protein MurJ [Candidatus Moranbacteria bacterium]